MSAQELLRSHEQEPFDEEKHLTNLNTNHSLFVSQTLGEMESKLEQNKINYNQTKEISYTSKQVYRSTYTEKLLSKKPNIQASPILEINGVGKNQFDLFIKSMKMVAFLNKQATERQIFIENKKRRIKKLHLQISILEQNVKLQKNCFLQKQKGFKERIDSMKKVKKQKNKRVATEIADIKFEIDSMRRKLTVYESGSCSRNNPTIANKRRNSLRVCTEEKVYIPLPYGNHPGKFPQKEHYQYVYPQGCFWPNPQFPHDPRAEILCSDSERRSNKSSTLSRNHQIQPFPKFIHIIDQESLRFSRSKTSNLHKQPSKSNTNSKKPSIFDESSVKIMIDQSESFIKSDSMKKSVKKVIKHHSQAEKPDSISIFLPSKLPRDFRLGDLEESVESQYTATQKSVQAVTIKYSNPTNSQKFRGSFLASNEVSQQNDAYDEINSIVLTSKSKFSRQPKERQSKYINSSLLQSEQSNSGLGDGKILTENSFSTQKVNHLQRLDNKIKQFDAQIHHTRQQTKKHIKTTLSNKKKQI